MTLASVEGLLIPIRMTNRHNTIFKNGVSDDILDVLQEFYFMAISYLDTEHKRTLTVLFAIFQKAQKSTVLGSYCNAMCGTCIPRRSMHGQGIRGKSGPIFEVRLLALFVKCRWLSDTSKPPLHD